MSSASAFFILIPAIYALLTLAMVTIAVFDQRLIAARWAALGFFVAGVSITVDGMRDPGGERWISWFTVVTHFIPLLIMIQAFLSRHGHNAPRATLALVALSCVMVMPNMVWAPPYWLRGVIVQAVCTVIIASGLPLLWRLRWTSTLDRVIFYVVLAGALSYAGKTVVLTLNPIGQSTEAVVAFYEGLNIVFHSASALMGMSVGMVLLMTIGFDLVRLRIEEGEVDPLTQIGNRRALDRHIAQDAGGRRPIGAGILVDLDHFKRINDSYGHPAGDHILRSVAQTLERYTRTSDFVARLGGEEFVILLPDTTEQNAMIIADKLREVIAASQYQFDGHNIAVTVSCGVATLGEGASAQHLYEHADRALYSAKQSGRNRCEAARD